MGVSIKALHCGSFGVDWDSMLAGPKLSPTKRAAERRWYSCPSLSYVIEHPDGLLLFDSSIYSGWESDWPQELIDGADYSDISGEKVFASRLEQLRLDPSDFKYVFLSHLHCDHAGNARLFAGTSAQILVHERELTGVAQLESEGKNLWNFYLSADYSVHGLKYTTLYGDMEIMKGIHAVSLPGHTWGTMGLMVELDHSGTVILASDALYVVETAETEIGSMTDMNRDEWRSSVHKLKFLQKARDAMIIPGHDLRVVHHECSCHPLRGEQEIRLWPVAQYE